MQSPQRRAEHRAVANRTRRDTDAANEWAQAQGVQLTDLDGNSQSPAVLATPQSIADTPAMFTPRIFHFDMTGDEAQARYSISHDDFSLALADREAAQRSEILEWLGIGERQFQRRLRNAGRRLAYILQAVANIEATPETVFDVIDGLPTETKSEIARLVQSDVDTQTIEKVITASTRERRLNRGVLKVLDSINRNDDSTREEIAPLTQAEQKAALTKLVVKWREDYQKSKAADWRKNSSFHGASTGGDVELTRLFYALPQADRRAFVQNTISAFLDDESLQ